MTIVRPNEVDRQELLAGRLCALYSAYNHREFVHPDPLEFLYRYDDLQDREIAGLIASSLAYGAVGQILKSVRKVLDRMESPHEFVRSTSEPQMEAMFSDFKHRFSTGLELAGMLAGVKRVLKRYGSLRACFSHGLGDDEESVVPALGRFVGELSAGSCGRPASLLPDPSRGSACKRLHLFLRWMVRRDEVDPGGWDEVSPSRLVVPLDTHMHRLGQSLGLTRRKQADLKTALEITSAFAGISPEDPVRYDFCLTRLGIRPDLSPDEFLKACEGLGPYR